MYGRRGMHAEASRNASLSAPQRLPIRWRQLQKVHDSAQRNADKAVERAKTPPKTPGSEAMAQHDVAHHVSTYIGDDLKAVYSSVTMSLTGLSHTIKSGVSSSFTALKNMADEDEADDDRAYAEQMEGFDDDESLDSEVESTDGTVNVLDQDD